MQNFEIPPEARARRKHRLGRDVAYETIDPARTAFVVVDMQKYFMETGMPACCDSARDIVGAVNRLANAMRRTGGLVVWIVTEALPGEANDWLNFYETYSPDAAKQRLELLGRGGAGFPLWPELDRRDEDLTITKTRYSAFIRGSSDLDAELRAHTIDTILVGGVSTNVCCESTARDAMMLGYRTLMVSDANAAFDEDEHQASLTGFYLYFGDVQTSGEIAVRLEAGASRAAE